MIKNLNRTIILNAIVILVWVIVAFFLYQNIVLSEEVIIIDDVEKLRVVTGDYHIIDDFYILEGDNTCVIYESINYGVEIFEVTSSFSFNGSEDAWIGYKFRSSKPDKQLWECEDGYFYIFRATSIELGRITSESGLEILTTRQFDFDESKFYNIRFTITNEEDTSYPKIRLEIDKKELFNYIDQSATNKLINNRSELSINLFQVGETIIRLNDDNNVYVNQVENPISLYNTNELQTQKWFIHNPPKGDGISFYDNNVLIQENSIELKGIGSVGYKNSIIAKVLNFDIQLINSNDEVNSSTVIWFAKSERSSVIGHNNKGLIIYADGTIGLVESENNKMVKHPCISTDIDFEKETNISISWENIKDEMVCRVYINQLIEAYEFVIRKPHIFEKERNFISLYNGNPYNHVRLSNIKFIGYEEEYYVDNYDSKIYLEDWFSEDGQEFIHFDYYNNGDHYYKVEASNFEGMSLGTCYYPENIINIDGNNNNQNIVLTLISIDGQASTDKSVLNSEDKVIIASNHTRDLLDRIVIKEDTVYGAGFMLENSQKDIYINGINVIKIRFGDHSQFEANSIYMKGDYDSLSAESQFKYLSEHNMNVVRVFVTSGRHEFLYGTGGEPGRDESISSAYMDNIVVYLEIAKRYGVYVMFNFCENELPNNDVYSDVINHQQDILFTRKGLDAKLLYTKQFLEYIKNYDETLLTAIFAIEAQNEFVYYTELPPFDQVSGDYQFFGNKALYNMEYDDERRNLANAAIKYYYSKLKNTLTEIDDKLLLCEGTCTLSYSGASHNNGGLFPADYNYTPLSAQEYLSTAIDFLDIHCYQRGDNLGDGQTFIKDELISMGIDTPEVMELRKYKPIILGEFAGDKMLLENITLGQQFVIDQQQEAIKLGVKGSLIWHLSDDYFNDYYSYYDYEKSYQNSLENPKDLGFVIAIPETPKKIPRLIINLIGIVIIVVIVGFILVKIIRSKLSKDKQLKYLVDNKQLSNFDVDDQDGNDQLESLEINREKYLELEIEFTDYCNKVKEKFKENSIIVNLFGETSFLLNNESNIGLLSKKVEEVLIFFLVENKPVNKEHVIDHVWGDKESKNYDDLFHATLYKLRKQLKKIDDSREYIVCKNRMYYIHDSSLFSTHLLYTSCISDLIKKAEEVKFFCNELLYEVLDLLIGFYQGPFSSEFDYENVEVDRAFYDHIIVEIYEYLLISSYHNKQTKLNHYSFGLLEIDPYNELAYYHLIKQCEKTKEVKKAINFYSEYKELLASDLGIRPSSEIERLMKKFSHK